MTGFAPVPYHIRTVTAQRRPHMRKNLGFRPTKSFGPSLRLPDAVPVCRSGRVPHPLFFGSPEGISLRNYRVDIVVYSRCELLPAGWFPLQQLKVIIHLAWRQGVGLESRIAPREVFGRIATKVGRCHPDLRRHQRPMIRFRRELFCAILVISIVGKPENNDEYQRRETFDPDHVRANFLLPRFA